MGVQMRAPSRTYLAVIDVADGANVDMGLGTLEDGVCAVDVEDGRDVLLLERGRHGVDMAASQRGPCCPQEGGDGSERRHFDGLKVRETKEEKKRTLERGNGSRGGRALWSHTLA